MELTQAEYDALSREEKNADVIYLITDSPDNYLDEVFGDFASVEYTSTASKAYAVGDYLVYNSRFYKVTSSIAQGGTIAVGTNVVKTTVGDELDAIVDNLTANDVSYRNSTSGLSATNVQSALDEVVSDTQSKLIYQATDYNPEISSIGAESGTLVTIPITTPSGYQLLGNCYVGALWVAGIMASFDGDYTTSTSPRVYLFNPTGVARNTASLRVKVYSLFEKVGQ